MSPTIGAIDASRPITRLFTNVPVQVARTTHASEDIIIALIKSAAVRLMRVILFLRAIRCRNKHIIVLLLTKRRNYRKECKELTFRVFSLE